MIPIDTPALVFRLAGALIGSIVALIMVEPNSFSGALKRGVVSTAMGLVFADIVAEWMHWSMLAPNKIIASSFLSAMLGWWIADAMIRLARTRAGEYVKDFVSGKRRR